MHSAQHSNSISRPITLFDELGGMDNMKAIVNALIAKNKAHPIVCPYFQYTEA